MLILMLDYMLWLLNSHSIPIHTKTVSFYLRELHSSVIMRIWIIYLSLSYSSSLDHNHFFSPFLLHINACKHDTITTTIFTYFSHFKSHEVRECKQKYCAVLSRRKVWSFLKAEMTLLPQVVFGMFKYRSSVNHKLSNTEHFLADCFCWWFPCLGYLLLFTALAGCEQLLCSMCTDSTISVWDSRQNQQPG